MDTSDTSTRAKVSLLVMGVLSLVGAAYGFINFNETIGPEYRGAPGWLLGSLSLALAISMLSYLVKMMRGKPLD